MKVRPRHGGHRHGVELLLARLGDPPRRVDSPGVGVEQQGHHHRRVIRWIAAWLIVRCHDLAQVQRFAHHIAGQMRRMAGRYEVLDRGRQQPLLAHVPGPKGLAHAPRSITPRRPRSSLQSPLLGQAPGVRSTTGMPPSWRRGCRSRPNCGSSATDTAAKNRNGQLVPTSYTAAAQSSDNCAAIAGSRRRALFRLFATLHKVIREQRRTALWFRVVRGHQREPPRSPPIWACASARYPRAGRGSEHHRSVCAYRAFSC